jgi:hypothetical protein
MGAKTFHLVLWWIPRVHDASFRDEPFHPSYPPTAPTARYLKNGRFSSLASSGTPEGNHQDPKHHRWKYCHKNPHHHGSINMALLAASRTAPSVSLSQRSDVISVLYPLVNSALQFQLLLGSAAFHLLVRTYFAAAMVATLSLWASKSIAWRTFLASRVVAARSLFLAKRLAWTAWDCKRSRRFRKRLQFELFVLLLGPGGNTLLLMIFWPGWLMFALLGWGIWQMTG